MIFRQHYLECLSQASYLLGGYGACALAEDS